MTYQEIEDTVRANPALSFPLQQQTEDGNRLVISEGYENILECDDLVNMHYYKIYEYLPGGAVHTTVLYRNGGRCDTTK